MGLGDLLAMVFKTSGLKRAPAGAKSGWRRLRGLAGGALGIVELAGGALGIVELCS